MTADANGHTEAFPSLSLLTVCLAPLPSSVVSKDPSQIKACHDEAVSVFLSDARCILHPISTPRRQMIGMM